MKQPGKNAVYSGTSLGPKRRALWLGTVVFLFSSKSRMTEHPSLLHQLQAIDEPSHHVHSTWRWLFCRYFGKTQFILNQKLRRRSQAINPAQSFSKGQPITPDNSFDNKSSNSAVTVRLNEDNPANASDPDCTRSAGSKQLPAKSRPASGYGAGGFGLHIYGRRLQPGAPAQVAGGEQLMVKVPALAKAFAGRWRIVEMDVWDSDFLDLVEEAHLTLTGEADGEIAFGALQGFLDVRYGSRDGAACAEFSWECPTTTTQRAGADGSRSAVQVVSLATSTSTTAMIQASSANAADFFNSLLVLLCHKLCVAAGTSWELSHESVDEFSPNGGDRLGDMAFGAAGRRSAAAQRSIGGTLCRS